MKPTTKYLIHYNIIRCPVVILLLIICTVPFIIFKPFEYISDKVLKWLIGKETKLRKHYNVDYYFTWNSDKPLLKIKE